MPWMWVGLPKWFVGRLPDKIYPTVRSFIPTSAAPDSK